MGILRRELWLIPVALAVGAGLAGAEADKLREAFDRGLAALATAEPAHANELRVRLIELYSKLSPKPEVPDEAERRMVYGQTAFKRAEKASDFAKAAAEFEQTVNAAPWWPAGYFNLALAREKAGNAAGAMAAYKLYLKASPQAKDASEVKKKIYELEYAEQEKATKADEWAGTWLPERPVPYVLKNFEGPDSPGEAQPDTLRFVVSKEGDGSLSAKLSFFAACGQPLELRAAKSADSLSFSGVALRCGEGKTTYDTACTKFTLTRQEDEIVARLTCYKVEITKKPFFLGATKAWNFEYDYSGPVRRAE